MLVVVGWWNNSFFCLTLISFMMENALKKSACLILIVISLETTKSLQTCITLESPEVKDHRATVKAETQVNITFNVIKKACSGLDSFIVRVYKRTSPLCRFSIRNDTCSTSISYCSCTKPTQPLVLSKIMDKYDSGEWKWSVIDGNLTVISEYFVNVTVVYRSQVTGLTVRDQAGEQLSTVPRDKSVTIVCSWENGFPPTQARLLDANGIILRTSLKSGEIVYQYPGVRCEDAGNVLCESGGSSRNMTTTLLVECAPDFLNTFLENVTLAVGGNISLVFPVQTHSNKITSCVLSKDSRSIQHAGSPYSSHIAYNCNLHSFNGSDGYSFTVKETHSTGLGASRCVCSGLTGIAPNLTLIVSMFNLSSQHTGQWRVIVKNYVGSGHAEFILNVTEEDLENESQSSETKMILPISLAIAGVLIAFVITLSILLRTKISTLISCRVPLNVASNLLSCCSDEQDHIYSSIPEIGHSLFTIRRLPTIPETSSQSNHHPNAHAPKVIPKHGNKRRVEDDNGDVIAQERTLVECIKKEKNSSRRNSRKRSDRATSVKLSCSGSDINLVLIVKVCPEDSPPAETPLSTEKYDLTTSTPEYVELIDDEGTNHQDIIQDEDIRNSCISLCPPRYCAMPTSQQDNPSVEREISSSSMTKSITSSFNVAGDYILMDSRT